MRKAKLKRALIFVVVIIAVNVILTFLAAVTPLSVLHDWLAQRNLWVGFCSGVSAAFGGQYLTRSRK